MFWKIVVCVFAGWCQMYLFTVNSALRDNHVFAYSAIFQFWSNRVQWGPMDSNWGQIKSHWHWGPSEPQVFTIGPQSGPVGPTWFIILTNSRSTATTDVLLSVCQSDSYLCYSSLMLFHWARPKRTGSGLSPSGKG